MTEPVKTRKKLIEVALPLEAINEEALRRKQKAPKGWPTSFHKWWAQRPLAACRAVVLASLIDDPSSRPDLFPTEQEQRRERDRLFAFIAELVKWENSGNESLFAEARKLIDVSAGDGTPPILADPFCGSGSIPLEGQRLGIEVYATDLNPVAVLITKATVEIPAIFSSRKPINPMVRQSLVNAPWPYARGLASDVRYYALRLRDEAAKRIAKNYPDILIASEMAHGRPDLKHSVGRKLMPIAWLWARTVKSPDPAYRHVEVPLSSTFVLSTKSGREAYVQPDVEGDRYSFHVRVGAGNAYEAARNGTKLSGANFRCLISRAPISADYIKSEATAGRLGSRLMAVVAEGEGGRTYLPPSDAQVAAALNVKPDWKPLGDLPTKLTGGSCVPYGLTQWARLFTPRQLAAMTTFSDLISTLRDEVRRDAIAAGLKDDSLPLASGGKGASAYSDAIAIYLACIVDRMAYYGTSLTTWLPKDNALRDCMPRQGLAMVWDFAEANPLGKSSGDVKTCGEVVANFLDYATPRSHAVVSQADAQNVKWPSRVTLSTDPPYFDNISYADLSDFFYVWLRHSLRDVLPDLFATMATPKAEELIAVAHRQGSREKAQQFFMKGMSQAACTFVGQTDGRYPLTIYYAFKQSETEEDEGTASTGWETFLESLVAAGLSVTGTWPLRTEGASRMLARGTNALASSIVLVCRPRSAHAAIATRREFVAALKAELPLAVSNLQRTNIAPVDLAQAAIGPGMAIFTRYSKVVDAAGKPLPVRDALALINQTLDEVLAEQEGDFDADTRWALAWFEQSGFAEGEYGVAETLSKAKNTSVAGLQHAGILKSKGGRVRLLRPDELSADWDPLNDSRLTVWETVHHLILRLENGGEAAAAELARVLGGMAEVARELAYRLYTICERKKRAQEASSYNALVQSWPEISRLAREGMKPREEQVAMFAQE